MTAPRSGREHYDALVVGGGPAGLSATTWLARYRRRVLLIDAGEPRNRWTDQTHGYLSSDPVSPSDLVTRARGDLANYPNVDVRDDRVAAARRQRDAFVLETAEGPVRGRRVVLATGVRDVFPDVDGFFEHYGADAFHCPSCDGYEAKDREVVAIGWSEQVTDFALGLLQWASSVTILTDGHRFEGDETARQRLQAGGVEVVEGVAKGMEGRRGNLQAVLLDDGSRLHCQLAFFSIAHVPVTDLGQQLGCALDEEGYVRVDHCGRTTVPGVFAAGDVTPGLQLVQVAAAQGTAAGVECAESLADNG